MTKCCPLHPAAANRADRRMADRFCPCRGACDSHPELRHPAHAPKESGNG